MPSYLGQYQGAAKDRHTKIIRAIESVIYQTYSSWELIIVADGCKETVRIVTEYLQHNPDLDINLKLYSIPKQRLWSGVRNYGIDKAIGEYIIYLDIDDTYNIHYLESIAKEIGGQMDWYWFNDLKLVGNYFAIDRTCNIDKLGHCGTSNIMHKRSLNARWLVSDYGEDYQFIKHLKNKSDKYTFIDVAGYKVCHIPKKYDI